MKQTALEREFISYHYMPRNNFDMCSVPPGFAMPPNIFLYCSPYSVVAFQFLIPAVQVILFCLCIGGEPKNLNVAVVNYEKPNLFNYSYKFLDDVSTSVIHQVKLFTIKIILIIGVIHSAGCINISILTAM